MRQSQCLITLWASTACYSDSFTSFLIHGILCHFQTYIIHVQAEFQVPTVVIMNSTVCWNVMCRPAEVHRHFGEALCFHLLGRKGSQARNSMKQAVSHIWKTYFRYRSGKEPIGVATRITLSTSYIFSLLLLTPVTVFLAISSPWAPFQVYRMFP
jgi:hypothetical protein